jgi:hypothetical protein
MKRTFLFLFFLSLLTSFGVNAQFISKAQLFERPLEQKDSSSLSITYQNLFYLRDFEYYNKIQTGWTSFGTWHDTRLTLQPNKWVRFQAGLLLQKEFGDMALNRAIPFFSFQYQKKDTRLLFGILEGHQNHRLIEPLMQYDQTYLHPHEEGIQLKIDKKKYWLDVWLDWERRQLINDTNPEQLTGGISSTLNLNKPNAANQVKWVNQVIISHRGGQLSSQALPVSTTTNFAQGLWTEWNQTDPTNWLRQFRTDAYYVGYSLQGSNNLQIFDKGHAFLWNAAIQTKWNVFLVASYWNGHHFISSKGGQLYQSITSPVIRFAYSEPNRELFFINLGYEKELFPGFLMHARLTPYRDFNNSLNEVSAYVMFSYRGNFKLNKFKK